MLVLTYAPSNPSSGSVPYQTSAVTTVYYYDAYGNASDQKTTRAPGPCGRLYDTTTDSDGCNNPKRDVSGRLPAALLRCAGPLATRYESRVR